MTSADTRAKEIVDQLAGVVLSLPPTAVSVSIIATAIRQAENDKLEEAARELDLSLLANIEDAPKDWLVGFDYARDRVLSLKSGIRF